MSLIRRFTVVRAFAAALGLVAAPVPASELVEYYHQGLDHYFLTGLAAEIKALDSGVHKGWARTGLTIQSLDGSAAATNSLPVCRFYGNPARGLDSHFYSASKAECDTVKQKWPEDWLIESDDVFRVAAADPNTGLCPANTKAVYRLYNKRADINHRYTTDPTIFATMIAKGYVAEGIGNPQKPIAFCAAATQTPAQPAAGAPVCTVTSSTAFPVPGTSATLTASCTESPTTYAWINCASTGPTCTVTATSMGAISYSVVATNGRGSSAPAAISLNWQAAASAGPTCTVSASNPAPTLGSGVTLSSNCSHSPTKFQWLTCSALLVEVCQPISECANSTATCSPVGTQAGTVYYALIASNSAGASQKAGVNVDWRTGGASAPPPPPPSPTPSCTISPSSASPAVNTTLTLTASCTNSPTTYQWVNCTSSAATPHVCTTTETSQVSRIYRVQGVNASGAGVPREVTISWQQPPTAPPVCTVSASSPTSYPGNTVTLTASCTQSPTSYNWTGCSSSGSTCTATATSVGTGSYSVAASNSFGTGAPAGVTVDWMTPPPAGADFCSQYPQVVRIDLPWGGFVDTHANGNFPAGAVLVARITVPQNAAGTGTGLVSVVEYIDAQAQRVMSVSTSACDFRGFTPGVGGTVDPAGASNPLAWGFGINPNAFYGLAGSANNVKLQPGRTYYVNIRNRDFYTGANSCQSNNCNIRMTLNPPR